MRDALLDLGPSKQEFMPSMHGTTAEGDFVFIVGLRVKVKYDEALLEMKAGLENEGRLIGKSAIRAEIYNLMTPQARAEDLKAFIYSAVTTFYERKGGLRQVRYGPYVLRDIQYESAIVFDEKEKT